MHCFQLKKQKFFYQKKRKKAGDVKITSHAFSGKQSV